MTRNMSLERIVLGTANLGTKYGISNSIEFDRKNSLEVLNHAIERGVRIYDTAPEYGLAEELLGLTLTKHRYTQIITKIPTREKYTFEYVSKCLDYSLSRLNQKKIFGIMFHDPEIYVKKEIREISKKILHSGKIDHIGFSAYSQESVLRTKEMNPNWTLFQVPENILDRRLKYSTEIANLARSNNIFFIRSVFLQGLLLMKHQFLPTKFQVFSKQIEAIQNLALHFGVTAVDLCLSYANEISWSSGSVIGAATISQLDEILDYTHIDYDFTALEQLPEIVLDPRAWGELN